MVFDDGIAETEPPRGHDVETDVVIIGSGPAGAAAALCLSTPGYRQHRDHQVPVDREYAPGAHHQPALDGGLSRPRDRAAGAGGGHPARADGRHRLLHLDRRRGDRPNPDLGNPPGPEGRLPAGLAMPATVDIPQTYLEPILVKNATVRGTQTRFSTEYLAHRQDADGVDVDVRDRLTGHDYTIRAKYLIGADGARSTVARDIGLPMEGQMDIAGSMNITFKADIAAHVGHRPSVLYWVIQPGSNVGGIGAGLVRMVRPWNEWLVVWGYDVSQPPPVVDEAAATADRAQPSRHPRHRGRDHRHLVVGQQRDVRHPPPVGRVFCAGDAVHRHPPSNGLGSNTSIQDSLQPGLEARRRAARTGRHRPCWTPTPPSGPRSPSRSCSAPTSPAASSSSSSRPSACSTRRTRTR